MDVWDQETIMASLWVRDFIIRERIGGQQRPRPFFGLLNVGCVIKASKDERLDLSKLSCPPPIFTRLTWDTALAATPMRTSSSANPSTSADKRDRWRTLRRQRSYSGRGVAYGVPIKDGISTNYNGLERRDSRPFEGVNVTDLPRVIIR